MAAERMTVPLNGLRLGDRFVSFRMDPNTMLWEFTVDRLDRPTDLADDAAYLRTVDEVLGRNGYHSLAAGVRRIARSMDPAGR